MNVPTCRLPLGEIPMQPFVDLLVLMVVVVPHSNCRCKETKKARFLIWISRRLHPLVPLVLRLFITAKRSLPR
jgi:hypothetical protein